MIEASLIAGALESSRDTLTRFIEDESCMAGVLEFSKQARAALISGNKLLSCGNGGSLCDAMHFAEEWTGRFRQDRRALPAISLSDPSQLTCIGNDFGFDAIFDRQIEALAVPGDLLVAISTSGNSPNIVRAVESARSRSLKTVGLLGKGGGEVGRLVDVPIVVPDAVTSDRIQEIHIKVIHTVIEVVERQLFPENY